MKKVLILSFSEIQRDPRVCRQIQCLSKDFFLTVAGFGVKPSGLDVNFVSLPRPAQGPLWKTLPKKSQKYALMALGCFEKAYWILPDIASAQRILANQEFDILLANDIHSLPLALKLAGNRPVHLDAHEYAPKEFEDRPRWRITLGRVYRYICEVYLPRVKSMSTVCDSIAAEYQNQFGIKCEVVRNAPNKRYLKPSPVSDNRLRLIHHGATSRSRHLELMIDMMNHLDERFELDLMLMPNDPNYLWELKEKARINPQIKFIDPVSMLEIPEKINRYDIGIYLIPPVNFNYQYALPNKFFEFIQARLAIASGPSPEVKKLVEKFELGVVSADFSPESLAKSLNALNSEAVTRFKQAAHRAAEVLCFEHEAETWLKQLKAIQ